MLVKDLGGQWPRHLIAQSHLWHRDVKSIRPLDLDIFVRQHSTAPTRFEALRQVQFLVDESWAAFCDESIDAPLPLSFYDPNPPQRITVGDLVEWLKQTSVARRRAILFALETKLPIEDIINLTWPKFIVLAPQISGYARKVAQSMTRHIRLNYVFWETADSGIAMPMIGLEQTMLDVSQGLGYQTLQRLYDHAIPVDTSADHEDFLQQFCVELNNRIGKE